MKPVDPSQLNSVNVNVNVNISERSIQNPVSQFPIKSNMNSFNHLSPPSRAVSTSVLPHFFISSPQSSKNLFSGSNFPIKFAQAIVNPELATKNKRFSHNPAKIHI